MPKFLTLTALFAIFQIGMLHATHLRSGEIHVKQEQTGSLKARVTITVYTNTINTQVLFGGPDDVLNFGDGSDPDGDGIIGILVTETRNTPRPDLGEGIGMASFTIEHVYPSSGTYTLSYSEPNRNEGVVNMDGSVNTRFYIETSITLGSESTYSTPRILTPPIFAALLGENISRSIACTDSVNQLLFTLVVPKRDRETEVAGYKLPPKLSLNQHTGKLTWNMKEINAPAIVGGEYAVAVKVSQMRGNRLIGYMIRDFQIILKEGEPQGEVIEDPDVSDDGRVYTPEGDSTSIKIVASGFMPDEDTIMLYSDLAGTDALQLETYDSTTSDELLQVAKLTFHNRPDIVREAPYFATIRIRFDEQNVVDINYAFYTNPIEEPKQPVAVERPLKITPHAYPNPAKKYLHLNLDQTLPAFVQVRNLQGQLISQFRTQGDVDMSGLTPGAYILTVQQKNQVSVVKVVKED